MCRGGRDGFQRVLVCVLCLLVYTGCVALPQRALGWQEWCLGEPGGAEQASVTAFT